MQTIEFLSISADSTLSGLDTTSDISYKVDANATFGDLINGLGGLKLSTPQRKCIYFKVRRNSFTADMKSSFVLVCCFHFGYFYCFSLISSFIFNFIIFVCFPFVSFF